MLPSPNHNKNKTCNYFHNNNNSRSNRGKTNNKDKGEVVAPRISPSPLTLLLCVRRRYNLVVGLPDNLS
eukprot:m.47998 g.47998  ORF g.47998 m.47998 type:complete len:69 (+) comp17728_c0_seq1:400-606(+)